MEIKDITDNSLAEMYVSINTDLKKLGEEVTPIKAELLARTDEKGDKKGKHKVLGTEQYTITKELRESKSIIQEKAIPLLDDLGLSDLYQTMGMIKPKVKDIPKEVLEQISNYFEFQLVKTVEKDVYLNLIEEGKITEEQAEATIEISKTYALKVTKK